MATVDENVVQLRLDDNQFNKASDRTIKRLDELKNALNFDGAVGSFKEIDKAAKKVNLSPLEKGAQAVSLQFNAMYAIADTTFRRIVDGAVSSGTRLVKSLTVDNITDGWAKYADKTSAVQTIMAATANQFEDTGKQMEFVEEQLGRLNWFTDETSFRFLEMVQSIGKFTANNISLEDSVTAMQGISTWAAISGANVNEAGRAMYNLSQAIAVGAVKLIDWKSIENANMSTAQFKQTAIETAVELGTLTEVSEGLYRTMQGNEVSITNFNSNLSDAWFTSEVLLKSLDKYGGFSVRLNEVLEETGVLTSQMLGYIDDYVDGTLDIGIAASETGLSVEDLTAYLEELGADEYELGRRAFRAAQETKTFQEAIDYVKESVGSGWMQSFEYIFGNFEEAKELWSELSEALYEVFVVSGELRNEMLSLWKQKGGRDRFIEATKEALSELYHYIEIVSEAWHNVFPRMDADRLLELTNIFGKVVEQLRMTDAATENLKDGLQGIFTVVKTILNVAGAVIAGLDPILNLINQISGAILGLFGDFGRLSSSSLPEIFNPETLNKIYNAVYSISTIIANIIRYILTLGAVGGKSIVDFVQKIFKDFRDGEGGIKGFFSAVISNFGELFRGIINYVTNGENIISDIFNKIKGFITSLVESFKESLGIDGGSIGGFFGNVVNAIKDSGFVDIVGGVVLVIGALVDALGEFVNELLGAETSFSGAADGIMSVITFFWDWLTASLSNMTVRDVADVAMIIFLGQLVMSITNLNKKLTTAVGGLSTVFTSLATTIQSYLSGNILSTLSNSFNNLVKNTKWLQVGVAITALVAALMQLSEVPSEKLGVAIGAITATLGMIILLIKALEKLRAATPPTPPPGGGSTQDISESIRNIAVGLGALTAALAALTASMGGENGASRALASLAMVGTMMAAIFALMYAIDKANISTANLTKLGVTMMGISASIALIVPSIMALSMLDTNSAMAAAASISVVIMAMGVLGKLIENTDWKNLLAATATITSISAGLVAMSVAVAGFTLLASDPNFATGLLSAIATLGTMILALSLLSASVTGGGPSGALNLLGISAALISLSVAMNLLAVAMAAFSAINPERIGQSITVLVAALLGFTAVVAVAQLFSVGLGVLAAAVLALGAAFLMFASGVDQIVEAVTKIVVIIGVLIAAGEEFGDELPNAINKGFDNFELIFVRFLQMIPKFEAELINAFTSLVTAVFVAIKIGIWKALPDLVAGVMGIAIAVCEVIARLGAPLMDALTRAVESLNEGLPDLLLAIGDFIENLFAGIGVLISKALSGLFYGIIGIFTGDKMYEVKETIENEVDDSFNHAANAIDRGTEKVVTAAEKSGEAIGNAEIGSFKDTVGDHSPWQSILDSLENMGLGFSEGTESISGWLEDSGALAGDSYMAGVIGSMEDGAFDVTNILGTLFGYGANGGGNTPDPGFYGYNSDGTKKTRDQWQAEQNAGEKEIEDMAAEQGAAYGNTYANSASSSAGSVGKRVADAYAQAFDEIDSRDTTSKLEYENWTAQNETAQESEKIAREIERATEIIGFETERLTIAEGRYKDAVAKYGENSKEAIEAYQKLVEAQTNLQNAQNDLNDLRKLYSDTVDAEELAKLQVAVDVAEAEADFYAAVSNDVEDAASIAKEIEYVNAKILYQAKETEQARKRWTKAIEEYGQDSKEAAEAYIAFVRTQTDLQNLQNELGELQEKSNDILEESITHRKELEKRADLNDSTRELEYKIWGLQNKDAGAADQALAELRYLSGELESASTKTMNAYDDWQDAVEKYGETSIEAHEAYNAYLVNLSDQLSIQDEIATKQKEHADAMQQAWVAAGQWAAQNRADLMALGFTADEITRASLEKFGWKSAEESNDEIAQATTETAEAAQQSADQITQAYTNTITQGITNTKPMFSKAGADFVTTMTASMVSVESIEVLMETINFIVDYIYNSLTSDETLALWEDIGNQFIQGMIVGLDKHKGELYAKIEEIINEALAAARWAASIASPSKETEWMGRMLDLGFIKGIEDYGPAVVRSMSNLVDDVVKEPLSNHTSSNLEFAGRLIAGGIAGGIDGYSYKVTHASNALIERTVDEFNRTLEGNEGFWKHLEEWGYDKEDFSLEVVMSLNTEKAMKDMTDFEKALYNYNYLAGVADRYMPGGYLYVSDNFEKWLKDNPYTAEREHNDKEALMNIWYNERNAFEEERAEAIEAWKEAYSLIQQGIGAMQTQSSAGTTLDEARFNYTQNIYSPKPLSSLDIYRNTNNALSRIS